MLLIPLFMLLSFGLLVALVGMYVLAYSKKEGLGKMYRIVSYLTITCGTLVCIGGIVGMSLFACCKGSCNYKGGHGMYYDCHKGSSECADNDSKCKTKCGPKDSDDKQVCVKRIEKEVIIDTLDM